MREVPSIAWLNGAWLPFAEAKVPLEDRGLELGEALYEVASVTAGRARLLDRHAARMRAGAAQLELEDGVPDDASWERIAAGLTERDPLDEGILYAQLTGGTAPREHVPKVRPTPTFFAYLRPHRFPRGAEVAEGIATITVPDSRWARCDLKTTMLVPAVLAKREAHRRGAQEAILLAADGEVREGAASSVTIVEGATLVTPERGHHILPGTTGPVIHDLAAEAGLEVRRETLSVERLRAADEVFVSSAMLLLMPVVSIDDQPVGGRQAAGPVARELATRLREALDLPP